ncbi:MAG: nucleotidyltransferase domain-containing protein [Candidatus Aenigmarchaeota archaeon]|nr:nucleotidyltransferase domain-containing protein [Candidatus Aenigmarchaeota archaeon]
MKSYDVFRFAVRATAFLVSTLSEQELRHVHRVILFGSAARLSATEESDIDLFFDVDGSKQLLRALRSKLNKAADEYGLTNEALSFKSQGVDNELSIKIGNLNAWKDLANSMPSQGIVLYSKYTAKPETVQAYTMLSWSVAGKYRGALLNKLYGYRAANKLYPGLLEKIDGRRIGRGVIMVPAESRDIVIDALEKYRVNYSRIDMWTEKLF